MKTFEVHLRLVGGGTGKENVNASEFTVTEGGALAFWIVTEYGRGLIRAIAPGLWIDCKELP